jgi:Flp pilus assembly protein TadG
VAIVEAAFVTPVFFVLLLGIIEGGLFMNDYLGVSSAVRAGARTASANGAIGDADLYTLLNVSRESSALDNDQIQYIVIYKANGFGSDPTATCKAGTSVTGVCNVYYPADIAKAVEQVEEESAQDAAIAAGQTRTLDQTKIWFGCLTSGPNANASPDRHWCPGTRVDTRSGNSGAGPDYVGIYIKANHDWVTKLFGDNTTITDQSVIQIEPRAE